MDPTDLGDPDRIRTCDPQIRNLVLYPAELPGHDGAVEADIIG